MAGWFALGLNAYGMLLPLALLKEPLMLSSSKLSTLYYYVNIYEQEVLCTTVACKADAK